MMPVPTCKIFEKFDQLRGRFQPGRVDSEGLGQRPSHGGQALVPLVVVVANLLVVIILFEVVVRLGEKVLNAVLVFEPLRV